jgi:hypothetical protein
MNGMPGYLMHLLEPWSCFDTGLSRGFLDVSMDNFPLSKVSSPGFTYLFELSDRVSNPPDSYIVVLDELVNEITVHRERIGEIKACFRCTSCQGT